MLKYRKLNFWLWLILLCPVVVDILALTIVLGWITNPSAFVTATGQDISPMQFNAALCFIFSSTAFLIGVSRKYPGVRISLASITAIISILTFIQYPLDTNFGIDTLFINPSIACSGHPGRMAPNAALAFVFISFSLMFFSSGFRLSRSRALIISLLASICFALGLVPLLGYMMRIETAYTWGSFTAIPIESSICFILLSIASIGYIWNRSELESIWLPIPIFIAFITVTISMSAAVYTKELNQLNQILESNAQNVASDKLIGENAIMTANKTLKT